MKDELKGRRRVLRRLGYTDDEGVVADKGAQGCVAVSRVPPNAEPRDSPIAVSRVSPIVVSRVSPIAVSTRESNSSSVLIRVNFDETQIQDMGCSAKIAWVAEHVFQYQVLAVSLASWIASNDRWAEP